MLNFFRNFFFINVSPLVKKGQEKILDFDDLLDASEDLLPDRSLLVNPIDQSSPKKFLLQILREQDSLVKKAWLFYLLGTLTTLSTPLLVNGERSNKITTATRAVQPK